MITISPIPRALVPVDSDAAHAISAPNYDEFQSDEEVVELLRKRPGNVLNITMSHCDVPEGEPRLEEGSPEALEVAAQNMQSLIDGPLTREVTNVLFIYEVVSATRKELRQIGLGGFARTDQIRTDDTPQGTIIRNEGIRPEKAEGRARLIARTDSYIGIVNCAVQDRQHRLADALEQIADSRPADFETDDEAGNHHRVWLVTEETEIHSLELILASEPAAYVADGNHRSAAAASLKKPHFLAVFFPTHRMHLEPYNRLVEDVGRTPEEILSRLDAAFEIETIGPVDSFRPEKPGVIGLYLRGQWRQLRPRPGTFDPDHAAESIDADIVQRHFLSAVLGITDPRDKRINFVGGNRDSKWLKEQVDSGQYQLAISLAPVTMDQFIAVCEQNVFMPPKSTWFDPKIRSGLVIALLDR